MDIGRKCNYISNAYYNRGLQLAGERNLTGSVELLKKSLYFNKKNTVARNLLGLIYFEMGEAADALCQWVISLNFQPAGNDADRYLDEIQRKPALLESYTSMIQRFNKILAMVQGGSSDDMGISQLSKLTNEFPNYVKASLLLAAICLSNEDYSKASRALQQVLKIDKCNPDGIRYLNYLKQIKGKSSKKVRSKNTSDIQSDTMEVLIPSAYKEQSAFQTAINIVLGILIGASAILFLYMPARKSKMATEYNTKIITATDKLNSANIEYSNLEKEYENLQLEYAEFQNSSQSVDATHKQQLLQYQKLAECYSSLKQDQFLKAAKAYATIDSEQIIDIEDPETESSARQLYEQLRFLMEEDGYVRVAGYGDEEYEAENYEAAIEYYDLSIAVKDNPAATYKKGKCYAMLKDYATANQLFTEVIQKWPESEVAKMAKADRGF